MTEHKTPKLVIYHCALMRKFLDDMKKNTDDIMEFDSAQLYQVVQLEKAKTIQTIVGMLDIVTEDCIH